MAETPTLYVCHGDDGGPRFHPCRRVQEALKEKGIPYEKVIAAHGNPFPFLRKGSREELEQATGTDKLPTLKLPRQHRDLPLALDPALSRRTRESIGLMGRGARFRELSPTRRAVAAILFCVSLVIVAAAERDIERRGDSEIRGNRLAWRLVSLNAVGAAAYLRYGRG